MFKKILIGLGIVAAAGLVLVLAPLAQRQETAEDLEEARRKEIAEAELEELEEE